MRSMVEGAHRSCRGSTVGPLRQTFGQPPPVPGRIYAAARASCSSASIHSTAARAWMAVVS